MTHAEDIIRLASQPIPLGRPDLWGDRDAPAMDALASMVAAWFPESDRCGTRRAGWWRMSLRRRART